MARGEPGEKMQVVVDSLQANQAVVVAGSFEDPPTAVWRSWGGRLLDIFAHPAQPIYDPEELNDFMFALVDLSPSRLDYFHTVARNFEQKEERLALGRLCFDETLINTALSARALRSCTSLRLFPDGGHLSDATTGRNQYDIPTHELGQRLGAT